MELHMRLTLTANVVVCEHIRHNAAVLTDISQECSGIFRPLRLDAGETSTSNACASTATITAKRREYAPEVESYDNVNDEIVAPEDVQKQDNRKEALQTTESMKALLSELAGELSRVDRFDILNRLNEAVNGVVRNAVNEMLGDGNKGRLTIKTERKRNGKKFMDDDSNLEEEARNILQTDRKLLQTCFICGERNPDANDDDEVMGVRYTDGPAESSAGYGSRTTSTSLTKLGNILDDNGEGTKRVEGMMGLERPVKTGHLSI
ncbi:hypothetical protein RB195_019511 [Necator americanus]|uniref:Uncharacterized protein n=1 Tax=Necator americanus TaxID=51031 RepID=A0ABR1CEK7_NECAM